jgi:phosphohistidine phosphatase
MQIYLLRHGIAEDLKAGASDADRALAADGRRKLENVLRRASAAAVAPSLILSSPLKRAWQTAQVASRLLRYQADIVRTPALEPGADAEAVWAELRAHKDEPQILLAGHEPLLSQLAAFLLASPALRVDVKKAALLRIDVEMTGRLPKGVLKWMITPALCPRQPRAKRA